ncbi:MAG: glycosyltransferase family 2 protein [Acidimicrobiales bacterium]|nr:glycosyltransferase family 2 protein [Acidimicrobiales bacterium]
MNTSQLLSVIMPVYNEQSTLNEVLDNIFAVKLPLNFEVIAVNDGSKDKSVEILNGRGEDNLKVISLVSNQGKGAAIREGLKHVSGSYVLIHDADLEYDPNDWGLVLEPILAKEAQVVYGSRFLGTSVNMKLEAKVANKVLTWLTTILFKSPMTDMETCMKLFTVEALDGIVIESDDFQVEPELTAKVLKKHIPIVEVPISYRARTVSEGKKIKPIDGLLALKAVFKFRYRSR